MCKKAKVGLVVECKKPKQSKWKERNEKKNEENI